MLRYTLRLTNGETVVIDAEPRDVIHGDHGVTFYDGPRTAGRRRTFPYVYVLEEVSVRVGWQRVEAVAS